MVASITREPSDLFSTGTGDCGCSAGSGSLCPTAATLAKASSTSAFPASVAIPAKAGKAVGAATIQPAAHTGGAGHQAAGSATIGGVCTTGSGTFAGAGKAIPTANGTHPLGLGS